MSHIAQQNFFKKVKEKFPEKFENYFDFILVDPPFITEDVWSKVNL